LPCTAIALFLLSSACTGGLPWRADDLGGAVLDRSLAARLAAPIGVPSATATPFLLQLTIGPEPATGVRYVVSRTT
jgi:hypothetical protein